MNVLLVTSISNKQTGGILTQQNILIDILKKNGHTVSLYVLNDGKNKIYDFYLPIKPTNLNFDKDYDLVFLNDPHIGRLTWFSILNKKKYKIFLFSHGWIFHDSRNLIRRIVFKILSKISFSRIDRIFCVSPQDLEAINSINNASLLWNPISKIYDGPSDQLTFNGEFVFVGINTENKNLKKLISLFNQDGMQSFKLNIIGNGTKELTTTTDNVKIYGEISDFEIDKIFKKASYYISLSKYEGFGISIVEAMSYGMLPILSNNIAHKYHIEKSGCGLILSDDIEEMARQIINFTTTANFSNAESLLKYSATYGIDGFEKKLVFELSKIE